MTNNDISDTNYVAQKYDEIKYRVHRWEAMPEWADLSLDTQHKLVRDIASLVRRAIEEYLDEHMQMYHDEAR